MAPGDAGAGSELIIIAVPPSTSSDLLLFFFSFWRFFFSVPYGKMKEAGGNYVFAGRERSRRPQQLALFFVSTTQFYEDASETKAKTFALPLFLPSFSGNAISFFLLPSPYSYFLISRFPNLLSFPVTPGAREERERERERGN